jgi:hypothetical protein
MDKPKHFADFDSVFMAGTTYLLSNILLNKKAYEVSAAVFEAEVQKQKEQEKQKKPRPIRLKLQSTLSCNLDRRAF